MEPFCHGGDVFAYERPVLDFSANLNPLGMPDGVRQAVRDAADAPSQYPDPFCRDLTARIASHEQLPVEWILCGNGAADLIYRLAWAVRPKQALLLSPCFSEYEAALRTVGTTIRYHRLRQEESFAVTARILSELSPEIDCMFLCNPNNPTGLAIAPGLLHAVLRQAAQMDILVVLDECFIDLLDDPLPNTSKSLLPNYPTLFVLKAFTKTYAMAGLRLGYGLCADRELLSGMRESGPPWAVSAVAQAAGIHALSDSGYLTKTRGLLHTEREFLKKGLSECGCQVWDSQANYVFFQAWQGLEKQMLQEGVLIRCCGDYRGLDDSFYRVAVRLRPENQRLIDALQKIGGCQ